eukprot:NODE_4423_length_581_cov_138.750000_g3208_i0.p1 GENE.NODE_4423_length_581_cov_138.750000_g3208_i0~~NODE_4423_length_581_cov_138.750000_g3208_i0.p1  ORF type:complete len:156 (-),score=34.04 NODE_4423_length_581_cov_138.750000_g3208_i0:13-480(-)
MTGKGDGRQKVASTTTTTTTTTTTKEKKKPPTLRSTAAAAAGSREPCPCLGVLRELEVLRADIAFVINTGGQDDSVGAPEEGHALAEALTDVEEDVDFRVRPQACDHPRALREFSGKVDMLAAHLEQALLLDVGPVPVRRPMQAEGQLLPPCTLR